MQKAAFVQWSYSGSDAKQFVLERSLDSASTWPIRMLFTTESFFVDTGVRWYGTYWYRVAAGNPRGIGQFSPPAEVYIMPPAFDLASITASQTDYETQSFVNWNYTGSFPGGTDYYLFERSTNGITWTSQNVPPSISSSYENNVTYSNTYWYRVTPHCDMGLYAPISNTTRSFIQAPIAQLWAWQTGDDAEAVAFWNYLGHETTSLYRSADGGATWPFTASITPTSGSTYYYIDKTVARGQTYTYKIQEQATPGQPYSPTASVTINPTSSIVTFGFMGDQGQWGNEWESHTASVQLANYVIRSQFSASRILTGGDNGYVSPSAKGGYQFQSFQLIGPTESLWACVGNHDLSDMGGINAFVNYFGLHSTSSISVYYTWRNKFVQGFVLHCTSETATNLTPAAPQYQWFSRSMVASMQDPTISWRIVQVHAPVLSSNFGHTGNAFSAQLPWQKWGVDVVLSGHNHALERLESGSVVFITDGAMAETKQGSYLRGSPNTNSRWILADQNDGLGYYCSGDVYTLLQATNTYMSISFYSGSTKMPDTGSTSIPYASMEGNSLILRRVGPQGTPSLSSSLLVELPPQAIPSLTSSTLLV